MRRRIRHEKTKTDTNSDESQSDDISPLPRKKRIQSSLSPSSCLDGGFEGVRAVEIETAAVTLTTDPTSTWGSRGVVRRDVSRAKSLQAPADKDGHPPMQSTTSC